tara:strand:- start:2194 stop:3624 length:1431 start_codon:yes stop_codon:yes gene_type:complete
MKFQSSDFYDSQVYIYNPTNKDSITYNNLFANAVDISVRYKKLSKDSLVLILIKDEALLLASIIACWINRLIPAIYSPDLSEKEYEELQNQFVLSEVITQKDVSKKHYQGSSESYNKKLNLDKFNFNFLENQIALVLFSSGTTGQPKAIPMSFQNINSNIHEFKKRLKINNDYKFFCASPIWHAHGLYNSFLSALFLKTQVIYFGQLSIMNAGVLLKSVADEINSIVHITPSMIPILIAISKKLSHMGKINFDKVICGASFLDLRSKKEFENTFDVSILQQYGMTETLFISINDKFSKTKPASVGQPLSDVYLEIWDNKVLGNNKEGVIRLKSKSWFGNYFGEKRERTDNFFYTGDIGYLDDDGCLYITGRSKDLIKKGGFSISSIEITNQILKVAGIVEAYTLSVVDPKLGEEIYSFYICENEIPKHTFIKELIKTVPVHLISKEFFKVDEIIKTATGKVNKVKMVEILKYHLDE